MRVNNVGMYLLRGSHRPKEFIDEYVKARQDYYDSIKDVLEILQQQETLQLCINVAKIGDTLMTDNEDCNANLTQVIKQQVDCMNGVTKKTDKKNDEDNDTTGGDGNDADNNRKPKEKPKEEEQTWFEKNKTTVIIGSVVGVVVLIMFAMLIIMLTKNKKSTMPMNMSMMNPAMNTNPYQYMPNYSY
jgi:ribosomal protein L18E